MQIKLIDYNVSIWIIGFSLIMAYVCPLESMATQRGVILIKDEHGKEVGLYRESYTLLSE